MVSARLIQFYLQASTHSKYLLTKSSICTQRRSASDCKTSRRQETSPYGVFRASLFCLINAFDANERPSLGEDRSGALKHPLWVWKFIRVLLRKEVNERMIMLPLICMWMFADKMRGSFKVSVERETDDEKMMKERIIDASWSWHYEFVFIKRTHRN